MARSRSQSSRGVTLVEVMVVSAVLLILASAALPLSRITLKRQKEMELHAALRRIRRAVDAYKALADQGLIQLDVDQQGYPLDLDELVEGVDLVGQVDKKVKLLRRIPKDPFTGEREWGKRSYQDDFDSTVWGGQNVYDVYSLSTGTGLDGTVYSEW